MQRIFTESEGKALKGAFEVMQEAVAEAGGTAPGAQALAEMHL